MEKTRKYGADNADKTGPAKEQALERWKRKHPGQEPEELSVILVRWSEPRELALAELS